ncbi:MAG: HEAT repeat domain-containing protein [Planctomycetaceae bacterium]|nr:HEAT repeat domain-containing protein [Planctomycetaceae bacterium]
MKPQCSIIVALVMLNLTWSLSDSLCADQPESADQPDVIQTILGDTTFKIPAGYKLEQVADAEVTTWPMLIDFAPNGDLLVVESGGVAQPIEEHNKQLLHRVVRLADSNGDGRFDRRTVVADQLPFTEGVLCVGDDVLITSPPVIYRLSQPNESGVYQERDVWFDGQTITWCANDLHGPFLGRDGWIYWCKGAFGEQTHDLLNGQELKSSAAHLFRRRLEGGAIEPVMTGGMDNPNGFAMLPSGERFFTSTFLHHPGGGKRDGIVHSIYGGLHGKSHDVLNGHWQTGPLLPVTVELGAAAPAGLTHWETKHSPWTTTGDVLVAALYNLQKITAHQLIPRGASYETRDLDLVVADRIDFHPTDVQPDADGSLLIVDTGGWYDLCCPTSRVDQKAANGGIYRLSRTVATKALRKPLDRQFVADRSAGQIPNVADRSAGQIPNVADRSAGQIPDATTSLRKPHQRQQPGDQNLIERLVDERRWVARRALLELRALGPTAKDQLSAELVERVGDPWQTLEDRQSWLWALSVLDTTAAKQYIVETLTFSEPELVQVACHAVSVNRDDSAVENLERLVRSDLPLGVRRAAAEALGRVGNKSSASALFAAAVKDFDDRHWQHSVTYALLELKAMEAASWILAHESDSDWQLMTAVTVLDQLEMSDAIPAEVVVNLAACSDAAIRDQAFLVLTKHSKWADRFEPRLREWFGDIEGDSQGLLAVIAGWREQPVVRNMIAEWLRGTSNSTVESQQRLLQVLDTFQHQVLPEEWEEPMGVWLRVASVEVRDAMLRFLAACEYSTDGALAENLRALAADETDLLARLKLVAALPKGEAWDSPLLADSLLLGLDSDDSNVRGLAAAALSRIQLTPEHAQALLQKLEQQTINTILPAIAAINRVGSDELDRQLLEALPKLPIAKSMATDQFLNLYQNRSPELKALAEETVQAMQRPPADISRQVQELLAELPEGNALDGLQVFRSNKAACSACHRLGYVGGELGPELSTIGSSRTRAALLEAILFPNVRLEQGYRTTKYLTIQGQTYTGIVVRQLDAESFLLQTGVDQTVVLRHDEIELQEPGTVSIMPSGIADVLSRQELADLLAILEAAR